MYSDTKISDRYNFETQGDQEYSEHTIIIRDGMWRRGRNGRRSRGVHQVPGLYMRIEASFRPVHAYRNRTVHCTNQEPCEHKKIQYIKRLRSAGRGATLGRAESDCPAA